MTAKDSLFILKDVSHTAKSMDDSELFTILLNNIPDTIYFKDLSARFIRVNEAQAQMLGVEHPEDAIGMTDFDFFEEEFALRAHFDDESVLKKGMAIINKEERVQGKDGEWVWVTATKMPIVDSCGNIMGMVGISRDITKHKKTEQDLKDARLVLETISRTDPLTSLLNRRGLLEIIEYEKSRLNRTADSFALILIDIDNFKNINDTYGHQTGDDVLVYVTQLFKDSLRAHDSASRWGGEEFLIVIPSTTLNGAVVLAQRIRRTVEKKCKNIKGIDLGLTISLGVSSYLENESVEETIKRADMACYRSKATGKNKVSFIE